MFGVWCCLFRGTFWTPAYRRAGIEPLKLFKPFSRYWKWKSLANIVVFFLLANFDIGEGGKCRIRNKKVKIRKWISEVKWAFSHVSANLTPNPSPEWEGSNQQYRLPLRNLYFLFFSAVKLIREFVSPLSPPKGEVFISDMKLSKSHVQKFVANTIKHNQSPLWGI